MYAVGDPKHVKNTITFGFASDWTNELTGFAQVMINLEIHGIYDFFFPGLKF